MILEKNSEKKKLRGYFWELSDETLNWIWSVSRYWINNVYVLCKDSFLKKQKHLMCGDRKSGDALGGITDKQIITIEKKKEKVKQAKLGCS